MRKIYKVANKFRALLKHAIFSSEMRGKDYIEQKPDGTLYVDGVQLDRDDLNAMESWDDLVNMGVSRGTVGRIALEYGGAPKNVDVWLERNSKPYVETVEEEKEEAFPLLSGKTPKPAAGSGDKYYDLLNSRTRVGGVPGLAAGKFKGFPFGEYYLSVQGSEGAYSEPRTDLPKLTDYDEVEIAIFDKGGKGELVTPRSDRNLRKMPHASAFSGDTVAGWISLDKVVDIMRFLDGLQGAKSQKPAEPEKPRGGFKYI